MFLRLRIREDWLEPENEEVGEMRERQTRRRRVGLAASGVALVVAALAAVLMSVVAASGASTRVAPPDSTAPPKVKGQAQEGQVLRATNGHWRSATVRGAVFSYQWRLCDAGGQSCSDIPGATDVLYAVRHGDAGNSIRVEVTATMGQQSGSATSEATDKVGAANTNAPVNTVRPTVSGRTEQGAAVTAHAGTWSGKKPIRFDYRWRLCSKLGGTCRDLARTGQTITLRRQSVGSTLRVLVAADNAVATSEALSPATTRVNAVGVPVAVPPKSTGEPSVSGTTRVGEVLRTTRGTWTGTAPISYSYDWRRCQGRGQPDASDCTRISNASDNTYVLRQADAGFRIRSQVMASNSAGQAISTSNPTSVVTSASPANSSPPTISGTASVGNKLTANRGSWVGEQPITYSFRWLRCAKDGTNCSEIDGATDNQYQVVDNDAGRALRARVTARNDSGTRSAVSDFRVVSSQGTTPPPPGGGQAVSVTSVPKGERLIVSQVQFSPNPVRSRTAPISIRVLVKDSRGLLIRGAVVFMRATPRVTSGTRTATDGTGWAAFELVPNANFPQPRSGFNVQFFVKAYRQGDPPLGGIAGYRLVQVRLAG